jgi:hypothetical protein
MRRNRARAGGSGDALRVSPTPRVAPVEADSPAQAPLRDALAPASRSARAGAVAEEIPLLTEAVDAVAEAGANADALDDDVPVLTDAIEEIEAPPVAEETVEGEASDWLLDTRGEGSVLGPLPASVMAVPPPPGIAPSDTAPPMPASEARRADIGRVEAPAAFVSSDLLSDTETADEIDIALGLAPARGLRPTPPPAAQLAPEPEPVRVAEPGAEFAPKPEAEFAPEPEAEFAAEPEAELAAEPEAEFAAEREAEPALEPLPETEPAPQTLAETEPAPQTLAETQPAPQTLAETEPASRFEPEFPSAPEVEPAPEPVSEPAPPPEAELAPEPAVELVPEGAAEPAHEFASEPASTAEAAGPPVAPLAPARGDAQWAALAEEVRMQVLQRIDIFTDTGLRERLGERLKPVVDRASADLVATVNQHVGDLLRAYVAEAIEREIERWRNENT